MNNDMLRDIEKNDIFLRQKNIQNWYDYRRNILCIDQRQDISIYSRAAAHEFSHFLMHSYTPYGLFLSENSFSQIKITWDFIRKYQDSLNLKTIFPIYKFSKSIDTFSGISDDERKTIKNLINNKVRPCIDMFYLENILEGKKLHSVLKAKQKDAIDATISAEGEMYNIFRNFLKPLGVNKQIISENEKACPQITYNEESFPFGASHIIENLAVNEELLNKVLMKQLAYGKKNLKYMSAENVVLTKYMERHTSKFSDNDYLKTHRTFQALAELALFTPIGYYYSPLRTENMTWYDIHPGHRFLRALFLIAEFNIWIEPEQEITDYQNDLCEIMKWVKPSVFLEEAGKITVSELNFYNRHKNFCLFKLENNISFMDFEKNNRLSIDDSHWVSVVEKNSPKLIIDNVLHLGNNVNDILEFLFNYLLTTFTESVMFEDKLDYDKMIPHNMTLKQNREEILRLLIDKIPEFRQERFISLFN
jgi:hypothetical protein